MITDDVGLFVVLLEFCEPRGSLILLIETDWSIIVGKKLGSVKLFAELFSAVSTLSLTDDLSLP